MNDKQTPHESQTKADARLTEAYEKMLAYVKENLEMAKQDVIPAFENAFEVAKQRLLALGELTAEEAEKIGEYLLRDVQDAAQYLHRQNKDFTDWLRMDIKLIEAQLLQQFSLLADHTKLELDRIAKLAARFGEWHTGEVTGIGTLQCKNCGQTVHFDKVSHVPPCPKCRHTKYKRP